MSEILRRLNRVEPARVRAVWTAVVMLLASAGVTITTEVDATVTAGGIGLLFALLALVQGGSGWPTVPLRPRQLLGVPRDLDAVRKRCQRVHAALRHRRHLAVVLAR